MGLLKIAHVPPAVVEPTATVLEAIQVMAEEGVGAVAVAENGKFLGIFTERDVMLRVVLRERRPRETLVKDVMTSPAETVSRDMAFEDALKFMLDRHVRHLPVVGPDGKIQAMLSIRNLLEQMVEGLQREVHSLDQYLSNDGPGG